MFQYGAAVPTLRYVVVDVFTDTPLQGNQLGVFTDGRGLDDATMQALALELGFPETIFVLPPEQGGTVRVRIFTPRVEMSFAGHPVLGAAWVLAAPLQRDVIELETVAGIVAVELERDESGVLVRGQMAQPVPTVESFQEPDALLAALGVADSALPVEVYDNGMAHAFVALDSPEEVSQLRPDMSALGVFGRLGANCFARAGSRWTTRVFLPGIGIPEDPATGSAAGPLACHLARHGWVDWGEEIEVSQGVELGRASTLFARAEGGDGLIDRVTVSGQAVVVARGEFRL